MANIDTRAVAAQGGFLLVRAFDPHHAPSVPLILHQVQDLVGLTLALIYDQQGETDEPYLCGRVWPADQSYVSETLLPWLAENGYITREGWNVRLTAQGFTHLRATCADVPPLAMEQDLSAPPAP